MGKASNITEDAVASGTTAGPLADGEKQRSCWSRFHHKINDVADNFFYRLGYWVATHPKRTLLISLVIVIACCFGFANFEVESDGDELWVPSDSESKSQEKIVEVNFDDVDTGFALLLMESPSEGDSVLAKDSVDALWELNAIVMELETDAGNTYTDLCTTEEDGVTCNQPQRGVTRFWGDNFTEYEATVSNDADILAAINVEDYPDGEEVNLDAVFGNSVTYDDDGAVTGARTMMQMYEVRGSSDDGAEINDEAFEWEGDFQDRIEEEKDNFDIFNLEYFTSRSIDDALEESVSGDIFLFVITYAVMIIFVMIALGRCGSGPVRRRSWLGLAGVMLVVVSGLSAYGLNSGFGVPFTTLAVILPFILIGIGVDDMFVVVAAFDHTDPTLPVEERIALGVKRCGVSVTYTSLTNFFAFMLGSTTSLPAVEYFCLYAGTAILFDFFMQMTAFVAFLTMDANRQKAGRIDWCCCFKSKKFLEEESRIQRGVVLPPVEEGNNRAEQQHPTGLKAEVHHLTGIGSFMKDRYTPFLLSTRGKAFALFATACLFAAGVYGVTQASQGFDVLDLAPDDHFARDYTELAREYEMEIDAQYIPLGVYSWDVDYPDTAVQAQIQETDALIVAQRFTDGPVTSWLTSFVEWAADTPAYSANVGTSGGYSVYEDRDTFYPALTAFLEDGDNSRFVSNIVYNENEEIKISRSELFLIDVKDTDSSIDALKDTRDVIDQSTLDPEPFGFSGQFIFSEQFLVIYKELITNFVLALVAVAVLSMFVLGKPAVVVLVSLTVVIIDVELLGFVDHWGLEVNSITVIELIMAVGLVVDYMVHIVHYFLHQDPTIEKDARIANALGEIGPSVMVGATTTFLGIMPMAFAGSVIFRVFFKMFIIIISFGFFHGVVFVPVALSLLPNWAVSPHPTKTANGNGEQLKGAQDTRAIAGTSAIAVAR